MGDYPRALDFFRKAVAIATAVLGPANTTTKYFLADAPASIDAGMLPLLAIILRINASNATICRVAAGAIWAFAKLPECRSPPHAITANIAPTLLSILHLHYADIKVVRNVAGALVILAHGAGLEAIVFTHSPPSLLVSLRLNTSVARVAGVALRNYLSK